MTRTNKDLDIRKFNKRLSRWVNNEHELDSVVKPFIDEKRNAYGKSFIIKRSNVNKKYALFVFEDNKLRRKTDKEMIKGLSIAEVALRMLPYKLEGISIFKTISMKVS